MTDVIDSPEVAVASPYKVIGARVERYDAADKVTGQAQYGADIRLPNMLYGKVLRSPHAHAVIRSIDTRAAEAYPGVKAVVTAADLPDPEDKLVEVGEGGAANLRYQSGNALARDKALYFGHAVAAVCATSAHIAEEALALIRVDYEVLPHVLDVRDAMRDNAPILHADMRTDEIGQKGDKPSNIASHLQHVIGDVDAGFREATVIVEREVYTTTVHQGYIEPHNATALYNSSGQLTVWCSTQGSFGIRTQVAEILGIPVSDVRVIPTEIGGGFGGKIAAYLEPLAAILSKKSGHRPVQILMSRAEILAATGPTSGSFIRLKIGADAQGRITAAQAHIAFEAGAYPGSFVGAAASIILSPYNIPNVHIDGYDVVVNKPRVAAYRAPGAPNAAFASEVAIDELSEKLGIDPLDFRILNAAREGDRRADGVRQPSIGGLEMLEIARAHPHYNAPLDGRYRGRGVACGYWSNYGGRSSASASLNTDGTVSLLIGSIDLSGARTSTAMQLAETLGIGAESIVPQVGDTNAVAETEGSYGSRTTFATGWAAYELGKKLIAEMTGRVAELWEIDASEITYKDGIFRAGNQQIDFVEVAERLGETGGSLMVSASVTPEGYAPALACHIVDIEVDPDTGKVEILRYTALQDVGRAIHPDFVEGQIQGGVVQGIGWALNETYQYDDHGRLMNANLLDYRMPTALDVPMIETVIVEVPNPNHPYGVRGVGEVPIVPPPAAIANALYAAVGVRMDFLPMSPANVLEALWAQPAHA
ncbi:MAG: xanthine dehydrogenase family protein molybdopterin-binding subunit [Anaerolineae bacterium]|nr:xanthine dehydrogenase family protein molybdopterin-binding subunit [Anaerolineae bacterium]